MRRDAVATGLRASRFGVARLVVLCGPGSLAEPVVVVDDGPFDGEQVAADLGEQAELTAVGGVALVGELDQDPFGGQLRQGGLQPCASLVRPLPFPLDLPVPFLDLFEALAGLAESLFPVAHGLLD